MDEPTSHGNSQSIFYKLMEEVGINGPYQTWVIVLCSVLFFQIGLIQLGVPYYFAVAPYTNCPKEYEGITLCTEYACGLPYEQRAQYQNPQISQLKTLGNQFGDFHCQKSDIIQAAMGVIYIGAIVGYLITSILADNIGRRITILICQFLSVAGYAIVLLAPTLLVAQIGLFMAGFGVQSCLSVCFCVLSEILENSRRQKVEIMMQGWSCVGGCCIVGIFYVFKSWRIIFVLFYFLPLLICLIFTYFFLKETPQFLIKLYEVEEVRKSLRFIAQINNKAEDFDSNYLLSEQHIWQLQADYKEEMDNQKKQAFTYYDLIRYPSLRYITIWTTLLWICTSFLYFAPLIIIDQFGFDFYINGLIINLTQLITFIYTYFYITSMKRKVFNIVAFAVAFVASFALIFLNKEEVCTQNCWNPRQIAQLLVFFVLRFAVSFPYQVVFLYVAELYPSQVAALGLGFGCLVVAVPNVFLPEMVNLLNKGGYSPMILFAIMGVFGVISSLPLKETDGKHPDEKIEELALMEHYHPHHDLKLVS